MLYHEILSENKRLKAQMEGEPFRIRVLSNIIVNQLGEILEYTLATEGLKSEVSFGNYDNLIQDSGSIDKSVKTVVVFWEMCNVIDGLEYKADLMDDEAFNGLLTKLKGEIALTFEQLQSVPLVIFNRFSSLAFNAHRIEQNRFDHMVAEMNRWMEKLEYQNVRFFDIDRVVSVTGVDQSVDMRHYFSSKMLYTVDFLRNYSSKIKHMILPLTGKVNKALLFDCDNTLWKGILGEDGLEGIKMDASAKGKPFQAVQHMALKLSREGILIGLCSKNNPGDVDEVLQKHQDMVLRNDDITIKKVNWENKASNISEMAEILNIGKDSFIFVDDSDFEIGLIHEQLPEIKTLQVNTKPHLYPKEFTEIINRFYRLNRTDEDKKKVAMYKQQAERDASKSGFSNIQAYLDSLGIEVEIYRDEASIIPRMAQMTQKTNQFNLTTLRYSDAEITAMVEDRNTHVYAISVKDKYGDSGITGLAITRKNGEEATIDTFLMSCRIIGRRIEDAFLGQIVRDIENCAIMANYIPTRKNVQVMDFFERFGFEVVSESNGTKAYLLKPGTFKSQNTDHIKINDGAKA